MKRFIAFFSIIFLTNLVFAKQLSIYFSLNKNQPKDNYFCWIDGEKRTKDSYDSVSGASKKHSLKDFKEFTVQDKNRLIPRAVRNLFLFATSDPSYMEKDCLEFSNTGKGIFIRFIHRGNAYKIQTDEEGIIDFEKSCSIAEKIASNKNSIFTVNEEFLKFSDTEKINSTDFSSVDWEKLNFESDSINPTFEKNYSGKLKASISDDGTLKINGILRQTDNNKEEFKLGEDGLIDLVKKKVQNSKNENDGLFVFIKQKVTKFLNMLKHPDSERKTEKPTVEISDGSELEDEEKAESEGNSEEFQQEEDSENLPSEDSEKKDSDAETEKADKATKEIEDSKKIDDMLKKLDSLR